MKRTEWVRRAISFGGRGKCQTDRSTGNQKYKDGGQPLHYPQETEKHKYIHEMVGGLSTTTPYAPIYTYTEGQNNIDTRKYRR